MPPAWLLGRPIPVELGVRDEEMFRRFVVALTEIAADVSGRPLTEAAALVNEHTGRARG